MRSNPGSNAETDEGDSLWASVLDSLRGRLSARRLEEISRTSRSLERTSSSLRVSVDSDALPDWLHDGRLSLLDAAVTALSNGGVELALVPGAGADRSSDPTRTLDRFIASPSNQEAWSVAQALAEGRAETDGAIIFHGPPSSGKTHLLRGIATALEQGGRSVLCLDAERISLDLVAALRGSGLDSFREPLRRCGVLLIDDAHLLIGREATQEELSEIAALRGRAALPLVLSSRLPPQDPSDLLDPLRERLRTARALPLRPPEWETRVAIILDRIALWRVNTVPPVASLLAGSLGAGLGRLDAVLTRLMTHPACAGGLLDAELVRRILENGGPVVSSSRPQEVIRLVSQHFSVRPSELRSPAKTPRVTIPRQLAMYLLRHHCGLSYPEIGECFRRHHTTAMHACRRIESERDRNASMRATVLLLEKELLRLSETSGEP